ncbi:MAG: hypothetical protein ACJ788_00210 [Ktedonobacteraceae bacterium]
MIKNHNERRTFYVGVQDTIAIQHIRERYGMSTDSDAVRFALRLVAESPVVQLPTKKKTTGKI